VITAPKGLVAVEEFASGAQPRRLEISAIEERSRRYNIGASLGATQVSILHSREQRQSRTETEGVLLQQLNVVAAIGVLAASALLIVVESLAQTIE
jgi:hypothetical protein